MNIIMRTRDIQYSFEKNPLWLLKLHLQYTGWLQYMPPIILGQIFLLASQGLRLCFPTFANAASWFATLGKVLLSVGVFDIITIKFNIRPSEPLPKRMDDTVDGCSVVLQRHSCRSFQPRKMTAKDRTEILQIAKVESKQTLGTETIRFEYIDVPIKVWPSVNAQEFLVAIGPAKYDRMAMIDVGRSLQAVVLHATKMGLATCWIGPGADHDSIINALTARSKYDSEQDHIVCVCAIGYKSCLVPVTLRPANIMSRSRKPLGKLFFADSHFQRPLDITQRPFNKYAKCYEAARWSPSSYNAQPTKCVGTWDSVTDIVRFDFFSSTSSRYYAPIAAGIWLRDWEIACQSIGITGQFVILSEKELGVGDEDSLPLMPVYNISWVER